MAGKSITAANAVYLLSVEDLYDTAVQLQGWSSDDVFDTDDIESSETVMGVDGHLSGGYVFNAVKYIYTLQADSPSNAFFDQWKLAQDAQLDTFPASGSLVLVSLGTKWKWNRGFLTEYKPAPDVKKIVQPRRFGVTWESVVPQPT